jgi:hypothetical protein
VREGKEGNGRARVRERAGWKREEGWKILWREERGKRK